MKTYKVLAGKYHNFPVGSIVRIGLTTFIAEFPHAEFYLVADDYKHIDLRHKQVLLMTDVEMDGKQCEESEIRETIKILTLKLENLELSKSLPEDI